MKKIIAFMKLKHSGLTQIDLMTDGCAGQFKNKFYFSNLFHAKQEFGVEMTANFYEANHGKSLCDSIGGTLKRSVRARVLTGSHNVYNAKEFVECALTFVKKIEVWEAKQVDVEEDRKIVEERWSNAKTIKGTRAFHFFAPSQEREGYLECAVTSLGHGKVFRKA
jgi:hypothetical protein